MTFATGLMLLDKGALVNFASLLEAIRSWATATDSGENAALKNASIEIMKMLIASDPKKVRIKDKHDEKTLLHYAAEANAAEIGKILIINGADINAKDGNAWCRLYYKHTSLYYALKNQNFEIGEILLESGAEIGIRDIPLIIENGSLSMVEFFLKKLEKEGTLVKKGPRLLSIAARSGRVEIVKMLLDMNIPVNCKDGLGKTPLHYARSQEVIKILLESGADINIKDNEGQTPPSYEEIKAAEELNKLLI